MELIKISTQETITFKQLRETYYNVAFPKDLKNADLSEYDAAVVATDPMPEYDPSTEVPELSEPTLIEGQWRRTWTVEPKPVVIPSSVTMRQARLQLLAMGLLDDVNTAVQSLSPAAQIEWAYATQVNRSSDFVAQMAALLEMTETDLNDFFVEASQL